MNAQSLQLLATIVSGIATAVIAFYAFQSHKLTNEIGKYSAQHHKENKELLISLITSTLVSGRFGDNPQDSINIFEKRYAMVKKTIALHLYE